MNTGILPSGHRPAFGQAFQGVFLEAPLITSSSDLIGIYGNARNWVNSSSLPATLVRTFELVRIFDGSASFAPSDATPRT